MSLRVRMTAVLGLAAIVAVGTGSAASAGNDVLYALKFGVLAHDVPGLWSGFQIEENAADINIEAQLATAWAMPWGAIRPVIGGSINTRGQTSDGYIDARWQGDCPSGLFFGLGLGAAVHDGAIGGPGSDPNEKWLGSRVLFHIPVEVGYHIDAHNDLSVYFEHMSNAYTEKYNEGMDRIGLRYGYRF
jgi:lipid A 3-O-deacylase